MMAGVPRTSVVIATFNGSQYLASQLKTIAAQTQWPLEVIIADDGSSDTTVDIARNFAASAPFPVLVQKNPTNLGFGENFLQAALRTKGEFIAFCDQDDLWNSHKIKLCEAAFDAETHVNLVTHSANLIDGDDNVIGNFDQAIEYDATRGPLNYGPWDVFFGFSMVFRRRLLEIIPPQYRGVDYISGKPLLAHDRWILFIANLVGSTRELAIPLVDYRQHIDNLYGAGKRQRRTLTRTKIRQEAGRYLMAAHESRRLVDAIAEYPDIYSYPFDHGRAVKYWDHALAHQVARNLLYKSGRVMGVVRWLHNICNGIYHSPQSRGILYRAALKDFGYLFLPEG